MSKKNLVIDVARCMSCNNCVVATKDEFMGNEFKGYSKPLPKSGDGWMQVARHIRGSGTRIDVNYTPLMCNHCDNAPCIRAAKNRAIYKRKDGIVIIDPMKAKGQRDLVKSCPYNAMTWNEEEEMPQIWFFDAHLLDKGYKEPRCVQACPTGAMKFYQKSDNEMANFIVAEGLEVLNPEFNTKPRVYYKNLAKCRQHFIGGNVTSEVDGKTSNIANANAYLYFGTEKLQSAETDAFGDFRFDGLEAIAGPYIIKVIHQQFGMKHVEVEGDIKKSIHLEMVLS